MRIFTHPCSLGSRRLYLDLSIYLHIDIKYPNRPNFFRILLLGDVSDWSHGSKQHWGAQLMTSAGLSTHQVLTPARWMGLRIFWKPWNKLGGSSLSSSRIHTLHPPCQLFALVILTGKFTSHGLKHLVLLAKVPCWSVKSRLTFFKYIPYIWRFFIPVWWWQAWCAHTSQHSDLPACSRYLFDFTFWLLQRKFAKKNNSLYIAISNCFLWILSLMHKHFGAGIELKICILLAGLFSNHGPLYFYDTKKHFTKLGLPCHIAKIHSEVITYQCPLKLNPSIEILLSSYINTEITLNQSHRTVRLNQCLANIAS